MNILQMVSAIAGVIALLGGAAAYFRRSAGSETIRLLETNIQSYKDAEHLKDQKIAYLEGQLLVKDETIKRLLKNDEN